MATVSAQATARSVLSLPSQLAHVWSRRGWRSAHPLTPACGDSGVPPRLIGVGGLGPQGGTVSTKDREGRAGLDGGGRSP